jgi:hypothetical protein
MPGDDSSKPSPLDTPSRKFNQQRFLTGTFTGLAKESQISGTVSKLEWGNPHVWLWIAAPNDSGAAANYAFEGTSPGEMSRRNGWTKNAVTSGDKVMVRYRPFRDGRNGGRILTVTLPDGRVLDADSGVHLPPVGATVPPK